MNITLSADETLIRKSRDYARRHNTTLNSLVRGYLEQITSEMSREEAANEFADLCEAHGGTSQPGYRFNRAEEYARR